MSCSSSITSTLAISPVLPLGVVRIPHAGCIGPEQEKLRPETHCAIPTRMDEHSPWPQDAGAYRLLFESNPSPAWVYDRETLAFLAVNDAAVERYGFTRSEFLSMTIRQ